jgi:hypothetical protein
MAIPAIDLSFFSIQARECRGSSAIHSDTDQRLLLRKIALSSFAINAAFRMASKCKATHCRATHFNLFLFTSKKIIA